MSSRSNFRFSYGVGHDLTRSPIAHQASAVLVGCIPTNLSGTRARAAMQPNANPLFPVHGGQRLGRFGVEVGEAVFYSRASAPVSVYGNQNIPVFSSFHDMPRRDATPKHISFVGFAEASQPDTQDRGRNQTQHSEAFTIVVHGARDIFRHSHEPCSALDPLYWDFPLDGDAHGGYNSGARHKAVARIRPMTFGEHGSVSFKKFFRDTVAGRRPQAFILQDLYEKLQAKFEEGDIGQNIPDAVLDAIDGHYQMFLTKVVGFAMQPNSGAGRATTRVFIRGH